MKLDIYFVQRVFLIFFFFCIFLKNDLWPTPEPPTMRFSYFCWQFFSVSHENNCMKLRCFRSLLLRLYFWNWGTFDGFLGKCVATRGGTNIITSSWRNSVFMTQFNGIEMVYGFLWLFFGGGNHFIDLRVYNVSLYGDQFITEIKYQYSCKKFTIFHNPITSYKNWNYWHRL